MYKRQAQRIVDDPNFFGNADTDWLDLVLRTGTSQNVDVSVSGGGANSRYYTCLLYTSSRTSISPWRGLPTTASSNPVSYTHLIGYSPPLGTNGVRSPGLRACHDRLPTQGIPVCCRIYFESLPRLVIAAYVTFVVIRQFFRGLKSPYGFGIQSS